MLLRLTTLLDIHAMPSAVSGKKPRRHPWLCITTKPSPRHHAAVITLRYRSTSPSNGEEPAMDVKPGDVVVLKSGGQALTVAEVNDKEAECVWIGDDGNLFRETLPLVVLERAQIEISDDADDEEELGDEDDEEDDDEEDEERDVA
jgi:uncharacterized protein YodC (DUF2158 family)